MLIKRLSLPRQLWKMFSIETEVFYVPSLSFSLLPFWFFLDDFRRKSLSAGRPQPAGTEYPAAWVNFSASNILFPWKHLFRTNREGEVRQRYTKNNCQNNKWVKLRSAFTSPWRLAHGKQPGSQGGKVKHQQWEIKTGLSTRRAFRLPPQVELTSLIAFLNTANCKVIFLW